MSLASLASKPSADSKKAAISDVKSSHIPLLHPFQDHQAPDKETKEPAERDKRSTAQTTQVGGKQTEIRSPQQSPRTFHTLLIVLYPASNCPPELPNRSWDLHSPSIHRVHLELLRTCVIKTDAFLACLDNPPLTLYFLTVWLRSAPRSAVLLCRIPI